MFNLINKKFNRLTVIEKTDKRKNNSIVWKCLCDCGNIHYVPTCNLRNNSIKSCGCLAKEAKIKNGKNNKIHGMKKTQFYEIWHHLKQRCNGTSNEKSTKSYKDRGITYDPRWEDFLEFKKDMYFKYMYAVKQLKIKNPSIERKENNKGYNFDNCTFIPLNKQNGNRRNNKWFKAISPEGEIFYSKNQREFARQHNLNVGNINSCLKQKVSQHKGWRFKYVYIFNR